MNLQPVILSGGSGTRLWPLSREQYPKQLLPLIGDNTLLQDTVLRLADLNVGGAKVCEPMVVCNEHHRFLVAEQLRQIEVEASGILLEPFGRNTAPALTIAALHDTTCDKDSVLLVMPADHVIKNTAAFHAAVVSGYQSAVADTLVTFGIVPDAANTGYGYIKEGPALESEGGTSAFQIDRFVEKPDATTAQQYLESGQYLWNSGMFMMKSSIWLEQMAKYRPDILDASRKAYDKGVVDLDFLRLDQAEFKACPSDSIDYAVMEPLTQDKSVNRQGVVLPLDADWSDVGVWSALWEVGEQDKSNNVIKGDVICHQVENSFINAQHRLVAGVGLNNVVVVETADAVLVVNKNHTQDVKNVVQVLKDQNRAEQILHQLVYRPWGSYQGVVNGDRFQVKKIEVKPGAALSLQMHHHRAEHWIVVQGTARVTKGEETFLLSENESTYIPLGVKHRLENPGNLPLQIIEVQSGSYLGEDDIVRFEDVYGRS